jgi:hypothetical protein
MKFEEKRIPYVLCPYPPTPMYIGGTDNTEVYIPGISRLALILWLGSLLR